MPKPFEPLRVNTLVVESRGAIFRDKVNCYELHVLGNQRMSMYALPARKFLWSIPTIPRLLSPADIGQRPVLMT